MEISVGKATADDYIALCELYDELDALHRDHLPHLFQKPDRPPGNGLLFSVDR